MAVRELERVVELTRRGERKEPEIGRDPENAYSIDTLNIGMNMGYRVMENAKVWELGLLDSILILLGGIANMGIDSVCWEDRPWDQILRLLTDYFGDLYGRVNMPLSEAEEASIRAIDEILAGLPAKMRDYLRSSEPRMLRYLPLCCKI